MKVSRIVTVATVLALVTLILIAVGGHDVAAQQCPKGKLRLYTSWPCRARCCRKAPG